ncbi:MAG: hypothetical protein HY078_16755 [Elusimicrobia bacterium]|nr:hypothetical protein [Elusimicrobiota bacterium]
MPTGPTIRCRTLPIMALDDLSVVRGQFQDAAVCELRQSWRPVIEASFRPAIVRVAAASDSLAVFAELTDDDVFTRATGPNQRLWELGDAFEIFLHAEGRPAYYEFHVAPGNQRLQMRIPVPRPKDRAPEEMMADGELFSSRVWPGSAGWYALAIVPFASIGGRPKWFSFSRYDHSRGRSEPVLSSTSSHAYLDFHDRDAWGTFQYDTPPAEPR